MDATGLMLSLIFGTLGFGFFLYGKKSGQMVPLGAGLALMVCPYFIPNLVAQLLVCATLSAVPFVVRGA
jgi:hypothetical protein